MSYQEQTVGELSARIDALQQELNSTQVMLANSIKPWFRDVASLMSILALLFSFGTTFVSYEKAQQLEVQTAKSDLRVLLQRLAALPKDNMELMTRYQGDANAAVFLSGYINQENALLAKQAADIADKIPEHITSTEYLAIQTALRVSALDPLAAKFLEKAVATADNVNDAVGALRARGTYLITMGQPDAGRADFQQAVDIFARFPGYNDYFQKTTHILTYLNWHTAEMNIGAHANAERMLRSATDIGRQLPPGTVTDQWLRQIEQVRTNFTAAQKPR